MFFRRKKVDQKARRPSWEETVELMQREGLRFADEIVEVLFSPDKVHRCVITKSNDGLLSYTFEYLEAYDEELLNMMPTDAPHAYWVPNSFGTVFDDMEILMRELKAEPLYKIHFDNR